MKRNIEAHVERPRPSRAPETAKRCLRCWAKGRTRRLRARHAGRVGSSRGRKAHSGADRRTGSVKLGGRLSVRWAWRSYAPPGVTVNAEVGTPAPRDHPSRVLGF